MGKKGKTDGRGKKNNKEALGGGQGRGQKGEPEKQILTEQVKCK